MQTRCAARAVRGDRADGSRGAYEWETYSQVCADVLAIAAALRGRIGAGGRVGIFSINRSEWTKTLMALWSQDLVCVPLYDTLGATSIEFIIRQSELKLVLCSGSTFDRLAAASDLPTLRTVIIFDQPSAAQTAVAASRDWELLTFNDIIDAGL